MSKQMELFEFIERPQEPEKFENKTMLERLFEHIDNPVTKCANCLCERCANNAEEVWHKVMPEEMKEPCFNCDECRLYTGEYMHKILQKEDCGEYVISDYAAKLRRKKLNLP